jgi:hypothetical protein
MSQEISLEAILADKRFPEQVGMVPRRERLSANASIRKIRAARSRFAGLGCMDQVACHESSQLYRAPTCSDGVPNKDSSDER